MNNSAYFDVWNFTRVRLEQSYVDLSPAQLAFRPHPDSHNIAELLYHIAGAENFWVARFSGCEPDPKLHSALMDGFLRDGKSPVSSEPISVSDVKPILDKNLSELGAILSAPTTEHLEIKINSPIGDEISGRDGMSRIVQHAGYHTGQIWMIRMSPGFPKN